MYDLTYSDMSHLEQLKCMSTIRSSVLLTVTDYLNFFEFCPLILFYSFVQNEGEKMKTELFP